MTWSQTFGGGEGRRPEAGGLGGGCHRREIRKMSGPRPDVRVGKGRRRHMGTLTGLREGGRWSGRGRAAAVIKV